MNTNNPKPTDEQKAFMWKAIATVLGLVLALAIYSLYVNGIL